MAGPNGLIPTLLVFGMVPNLPIGNLNRIPRNSKGKVLRVETAKRELETIVAQKRLKLAEKPRTKPMENLVLSPGSPVLSIDERLKPWEGPYEIR